MPQQKDSLVFRFRKWLGINYDGLFAFRERTRIAFRQLTCRMCDFVLAPKGRKPKRTFQPVIETLEVRQVPASYTWTGGGINSNWTNPANWSGGGGTLTPSSGDDVAITSGFVNLDTAIQIDTLTMSGGSLNLGNKLTLDSGTSTLSGGTVGSNIEVGSSAILNWTGGTVSATLAVDGGATLGISGTSSKSLAGEIDNGGHIAWTQGNIGLDHATILNEFDSTFTMADGVNLTDTAVHSSFFNDGTMVVGGLDAAGANDLAVDFTQYSGGTLKVDIQKLTGNAYDRLTIDGTASLDGELMAKALPAYSVAVDDAFPVLTAASTSGSFSSLVNDGFDNSIGVSYDSTHVPLPEMFAVLAA